MFPSESINSDNAMQNVALFIVDLIKSGSREIPSVNFYETLGGRFR